MTANATASSAAAASDATDPSVVSGAATEAAGSPPETSKTAAEVELEQLKTSCGTLAQNLHDLRERGHSLRAQIDILAHEAIEAGCRDELWVTHEGRSAMDMSVPSSELTFGKEGISGVITGRGSAIKKKKKVLLPPALACRIPGCDKKDQGLSFRHMCKRHYAEAVEKERASVAVQD